MSKKENLNEAIQSFFMYLLDREKVYSDIAKVTSVNETEKTCDVDIINGASLTGVRLQQVSSSTGLLIKPAVDSIVIISYTDKTTAFVSMCSQIDGILFQDGNNGGLIKILGIETKLNDLVQEIRDLKTSLDSHVHTGVTTGVASSGPPVSISGSFTDFDRADFENDKFKH